MSEAQTNSLQMTVDLKKHRIRIHKESLHQLGDPQYIQFLVNTESRAVAIRAVDRPTYANQAHKVNQTIFASDNSIEVYSYLLIDTLRSKFDCFGETACYHLSGTAVPEKKVAIFAISSAQPVSGVMANGR